MSYRDVDRVARIMAAHEAGSLNDLTVYALLAAARAEAVTSERERFARLLEAIALEALVKGDSETAAAFATTAEGLAGPEPRPADVCDA